MCRYKIFNIAIKKYDIFAKNNTISNFFDFMNEEFQQQLKKLQDDQKVLMDAVLLTYENLNVLLTSEKSRLENQNVIVDNQSKIINNQEIIVSNQMNIINNQALIVQNQITLRIILKMQKNVMKLLKNQFGESITDEELEAELAVMTTAIEKQFKTEISEIFPFSKQ